VQFFERSHAGCINAALAFSMSSYNVDCELTNMHRPEPASSTATKSERAASSRAKASPRSKRPDAAVAASRAAKPLIAANSAPPRPVTKQPTTAKMVTAAIADLKERGGSSLQAIKKYMAVTYSVDVVKRAPYIRKFLRKAVIDGQLVQTKGRGASGSFKLATGKTASAPKKDKIKSPIKTKTKTAQAAAAKLAKKEKSVKKARTVSEKQAPKVVAKKSAANKTAKK